MNGFQHSLQAIDHLGATRANLLKLLRSIDTVGWSRREESGRLDRRAFGRFACGDANIFSRRDYKEAECAAVEVLVDCSSSMDGRAIVQAQHIAVNLGNIFDKAKVSFQVDGFRTGGATGFEVIPFKRWGESFRKAASKLGQIQHFALGGTPDYSATQYALTQLSKRTEAKKILFLLTDAEGFKQADVDQINATAKALGVTIVAIGIGDTEVEKLYTNAVNVKSIRDLAGQAFNALLKAIKK
jgi:cobalamin biosynthesis protein CobT